MDPLGASIFQPKFQAPRLRDRGAPGVHSFYQALNKAKISKLSDWAEIENIKCPDPPDIKNAQFVNFDP